MATIVTVLQNVHIRYERNTNYPISGDEDFIIRVAYFDDAITEIEKTARKGTYFSFLIRQASIPASASGSDPLPSAAGLEFLDFLRAKDDSGSPLPAIIKSGNDEWREVSAQDGNYKAQMGYSGNVFWVENGNIRTLPAITGTITFPYLKKAERYPLGTESTTLEIPDEKFMQEFMLAYLWLDDGKTNQYNAHMNNAQDVLKTLDYQTIMPVRQGSGWGLGM